MYSFSYKALRGFFNCRKTVFVLPVLVLLAGGLAHFLTRTPSAVIAITQIAPHPSLDRIRQGLLDELKAQHVEARFVVENANGNIAAATQIAQKFVSLQPKVIIAITTPSAQIVYNLAKPKNIPVVFSGVSDPIAAKLVDSFDAPGAGITGVSDVPPVKEQVELIQEIKPDIKKVGYIYNPGEANSAALLPLLEAELKAHNLTLIAAPAINIMEVPLAAKKLVTQVDAFYVSNDNLVASGLDGLLNVARSSKKPIFASDPESVGRGALAALAADQYQIGRQTGALVARYLRIGTLQFPAEKAKATQLALNFTVAKELGIEIPDIVRTRVEAPLPPSSENQSLAENQ